MEPITNSTLKSLLVGASLCALPLQLHAWEPNANDLDNAIKTGHCRPIGWHN